MHNEQLKVARYFLSICANKVIVPIINNKYTNKPCVYIFKVNLKPEEFGLRNPKNENKEYKTNNIMKQRITLKESDLHRMIKESVKQVLNESYNDSQTISKIRDLRPKITSFIEYLEDKYGELGSGNDFLDRVYNSAYKLESDLQSFLRDDYEQQIYQY